MDNQLITEQPAPKDSLHKDVWPLVIQDIYDYAQKNEIGAKSLNEVFRDAYDRNQEGIRKYGTPLRPFNGRNALIDAYQEALDLCVYLKQYIMEIEGESSPDSVMICDEINSAYRTAMKNLITIRNVISFTKG